MGNGKCTCSQGSKFVLQPYIFLFCFAFLIAFPVMTNDRNGLNEKTVVEKKVFEEGDIILRYGDGLWSPFFRDISRRDKRFSHAGILVRENGEICVVHASAADLTGVGKVSCESLETFLATAADYAVYRLAIPEPVKQRIAANARNYLGFSFDSSFDLSDKERLYCTELVMQAVNEAAGFAVIRPTVTNGIAVVAPDNCYEHRRFFSVADKRLPDGFRRKEVDYPVDPY